MKPLTFSKNSWHYRFIAYMKNSHYISNNICGYFWDFIGSCMLALCVFFAVVIALYVMVVAPLMWVFVMLQFDMYVTSLPEAVIGLILDIIAMIFSVFFYLVEVVLPARAEKKRLMDYEAMQKGEYTPKHDSFVKAVWRKFHDKTCVKVEFK